MKSFIIAFSMYSKIPMPRVDWNEKNMRYAFCYFPLVGVVIGGLLVGEFYLFNYLSMGGLFRTLLYGVTPLIITGGIHMDGFIDTMDALNSYQDREKKLEILKDPHIGAFALIRCIMYYLITLGFISELNQKSVLLVAIGFCYSRALSGYGVVSFNCAKNSGLAAMFSNGARKNIVRVVMILYMVLSLIAMAVIEPVTGIAVFVGGILWFLRYKQIAYKEFGGITGDLAGYFIQNCELFILVIAVIGCRWR